MGFRLGLIGFGEVGQALAEALLARHGDDVFITVWDLLLDADSGRPKAGLSRLKVRAGSHAADTAKQADLIICAVTAGQTEAAARSLSGLDLGGAFYLDVNSASPKTKFAASDIIKGANGRFVEAAIMSPIEPKRLASPMLLSGPHARAIAPILRDLGFEAAAHCSDDWGRAAATKLCRSVMIKGLEALISESLLAARYYGVEGEVLSSLNNLFPHPDWPSYARYMITRTLEHGARRAEEMNEAAHTVAEAGLDPWMSESCAKRQLFADGMLRGAAPKDLMALLDAMRAALKTSETNVCGPA